MVITVTLNTAVDKTFTIPNFALDRVHRPTEWKIVPGGKGINVSRVLRELGLQTLAMGFAGGYTGGMIRKGLEREGLPCHLVATSEDSRECITVIDPEAGTQTEINENGPRISAGELSALDDALRARLPEAEALVLSGSIPPGVPPDIYARWISAARQAGVFTVLDSSGPALIEGVRAKPDAVKPNRREFTELTGEDLLTADEIAARSLSLVEEGISCVLVSLGRAGAVVVTRTEQWASRSPEIPFVSAVGSGDAFVAGFLFARHHGEDLEGCLRLATAAGSANAMTFGAGFCSRECILLLAAQVETRRLELESQKTE